MNLKEFLIENGYEPVTHQKAQSNETCDHAIGLPSGAHICRLKPSFSPIDGPHTVLVDNTTVTSYIIRSPYNFTTWKAVKRNEYTSPEELKEVLESMLHPPKGCWG